MNFITSLFTNNAAYTHRYTKVVNPHPKLGDVLQSLGTSMRAAYDWSHYVTDEEFSEAFACINQLHLQKITLTPANLNVHIRVSDIRRRMEFTYVCTRPVPPEFTVYEFLRPATKTGFDPAEELGYRPLRNNDLRFSRVEDNFELVFRIFTDPRRAPRDHKYTTIPKAALESFIDFSRQSAAIKHLKEEEERIARAQMIRYCDYADYD
jgi:hypothetical protein